MSDIINLLPDSVSNQIAAGEVIQRPASAVKELLENAIDSGADDIGLIIKDGGKTLIRVVDNGSGMSATDARMSFERHATSKIQKANDLFAIRTMGFRGEALASIAAIAQVELKTKLHDAEIGTEILIEGSKLIHQKQTATHSGSVFSIKNLFYNTPARRNFLKAERIEKRHIIEEFFRVSLMHPDIAFSFMDDDFKRFSLMRSSLKRRIVALFGNRYNDKLLEVKEDTSLIKISGFITKPEIAKTRGDQYFFVNNRFIKHHYLHHAIKNAFGEMLPEDYHPGYFINLQVEPEDIDINIHPTKTEVNFKDEKSIYSILKSAVKMTLGKHSLSPQLDFDSETSLDFGPPPKDREIKQPEIKVNPNYNPFETSSTSKNPYQSHKPELSQREISNQYNWQELYKGLDDIQEEISQTKPKFFQLNNSFIVTSIKSGLIIIDQQAAHERVLYDRFSDILEQDNISSQIKMFKEEIEFSSSDTELILELKPELNKLGFSFNHTDGNTFEFDGVPADLVNEDIKNLIESTLDFFKSNQVEIKIEKRKNILLSMAKNLTIKRGRKLEEEEQQALISSLFECSSMEISPSGNKIYELLSIDNINNIFGIKKFIDE